MAGGRSWWHALGHVGRVSAGVLTPRAELREQVGQPGAPSAVWGPRAGSSLLVSNVDAASAFS